MSAYASAQISPCGRFRYNLVRCWDETLPRVAFCMLNPSVADANVDDPTIRRCISFAKAWGCGSIEVVNLFPLRLTDPRKLKEHEDRKGWRNEDYWAIARDRSARVIAAWGTNKLSAEMRLKAIDTFRDMDCIRRTGTGHPEHPLYIKGDTQPVPYCRDGFLFLQYSREGGKL